MEVGEMRSHISSSPNRKGHLVILVISERIVGGYLRMTINSFEMKLPDDELERTPVMNDRFPFQSSHINDYEGGAGSVVSFENIAQVS